MCAKASWSLMRSPTSCIRQHGVLSDNHSQPALSLLELVGFSVNDGSLLKNKRNLPQNGREALSADRDTPSTCWPEPPSCFPRPSRCRADRPGLPGVPRFRTPGQEALRSTVLLAAVGERVPWDRSEQTARWVLVQFEDFRPVKLQSKMSQYRSPTSLCAFVSTSGRRRDSELPEWGTDFFASFDHPAAPIAPIRQACKCCGAVS